MFLRSQAIKGRTGTKILQPRSSKGAHRSDRDGDINFYRHLTTCFTCTLKSRCTLEKLRRIRRWDREAVLDTMQIQLDHMLDAMAIRRRTVEHPFGTLKAWMVATHFLTKTLKKVKIEISLHILAYNIKRMIQMIGVLPFMKAISA